MNGTAQRHDASLNVAASGGNNDDALLESGTFAINDQGGGLVVSVPWSDGSVHAYAFRSAPVGDYNSDVSRLKQGIQSDRQAQAEQQQQEQQQQADQQRQAAAHTQELNAREAQTCSAVGGSWKAAGYGSAAVGTCPIKYPSAGDKAMYNYTVYFDNAGNVAPSPSVPQNQSEAACTAYGQQSKLKVTWHADTDICAI